MKQINRLESKYVSLPLDHIDTDMIIPAQYLTSTLSTGYAEGLFKRLRDADQEFVISKIAPAERKILIAGENFGCGSSREHAVWALQEFGFEAIIASSFGDIFYSNALKNGLLVIPLESKIIAQLLASELNDELVSVNLENEEITFKGQSYKFKIEGFRKHCLINGIQDFDYLLERIDLISEYFKKNEANNYFI